MSSTAELTKSPLRFYIRRNNRAFITGVLSLAATNFLDALPPLLIGKTIDLIANQAPFTKIAQMIGLIFLVTMTLASTRFMWRYYWGRFSHGAAMDLQNRIFAKFTDLGQTYLRRTPVGELMSLIINDVQSFRMAVGPGVLIVLDALFILLIVPPLMLSISVSWTLQTLILMPLLPFIANKLMSLLNKYYEEKQTKFAELSGLAQEIISGARVIKSYVQEKSHTRLYNRVSREYESISNRTALVDAGFAPPLEFAVTVGSVILLFIGAPQVISGSVTIGSFFAFYQYISRMEWPATAIGLGLSYLQQGDASFTRIKNLFAVQNEILDQGDRELGPFQTLEVRNLSYKYGGSLQKALSNVSFTVKKGEVLGIIGPTGSGKSTLVEVLARILPVQEGEILFNGVSIEDIRLSSLRELMTIVPQEAFLFSEKVADNIALGSDLTRAQLEAACRAVDLSDEIKGLPGEFDAYLGERGVNLSGGQKQRLALARALARSSPLILMDDSLSAVDSKTEERILRHLKNQLSSALIVSHRVKSVRWADQILVLRDGAVEAIGTHEELLEKSPTYKKLEYLQREANSDEHALH